MKPLSGDKSNLTKCLILRLKYELNPNRTQKLKERGDKKLYEATKNSYFGIGATLHSREMRDIFYKGLNKLGVLLQELRTELQNKK
jgi:predicted NAD-dependent protein-ADP-ribosyltransferase YbiA (DUF1768 family)